MPRFIPKYFLTTMLSEMIVFLNYIHLAIIPDECKSRKMCLYAVSQKPTLICFVPLRFIDKKFCDELVKKTKTLFGIPIKYIDKEMSLSVVRHDGTELRNVPEKLKLRHFEICEVAFSQCKLSLMYIPKEYHSDIAYVRLVKERSCETLDIIPYNKRTKELCIMAIKHNINNIVHIPKHLRSQALYNFAAKKLKIQLRHVPHEYMNQELLELLKIHNPNAFRYCY